MTKPLLLPRRRILQLGAGVVAAPFVLRRAWAQSNIIGSGVYGDVKAGGGAFNPTSLITGAGGFWRADMGVNKSGANVTSWTDQSSFNQTLTATNNPQWSSTGWLSSFPGITLTGGNSEYLKNAAFVLSSSTCSIFILQTWASANSYDGSMCYATGSNTDFNSANGFALSTNNNIIQPDAAQNSITNVMGNAVSANTAVLWGAVLDGANWTLWQNGSSISSNADTSTIGGSGTNLFVVGGRVSSGSPAANYMTGTIAFCGVTQKVMLSADWTNLKNWSNSNWGTSF